MWDNFKPDDRCSNRRVKNYIRFLSSRAPILCLTGFWTIDVAVEDMISEKKKMFLLAIVLVNRAMLSKFCKNYSYV